MALLGADGYSYGQTNIGGNVGDINVGHNSWTNLNNTWYKWTVPNAGHYRLVLTVRTRVWSVTGFIRCRIIRNSDNNAPGGFTRMLFENGANSGNAFNCQNTLEWIVDTPQSSGDTWYPQFSTNNNSSYTSIQSDSNGYNDCMWYKIGD
tara:strand:- start:267 stop:713 length:447 start_codon:yes stop_codon:yes gene_type:complete